MAAEAVLGVTIQVLLQNLLSFPFGDIKLAFGCKKDISKLQNSLVMIQKFMSDAEKQEINNDAVKYWLQQLEDVAFEADAILDEFSYQLLRKKLKNQNQVLNIFPSGSNNMFFRRKMAQKIKDLNEKLEKINKDAVSYGLQMTVASALPAANTTARQVKTDSFSDEPNFVGRGNEVEKIVEALLTALPNETFFVVPIFGMGGAGKTTLARKVFNHEKIKAHFGEKIWVCVPIDFEVENLFKMILESLTGESVRGFLAKQTILEKIQKLLEKKRYLLILDDIWSEEFNKWEDFICSLSGVSSERGNGIVLTTRKGVVASKLKSSYAHQLDKLSEDDCWSIIKAKALLGLNDLEEFEETGRHIARRCGGLPLAANVIGSFLRGQSADEWLDLLESQSLDFGQDQNDVTKILRLSYDHLPSSSIKKCFAYCSVLPPHFVINRVQMIRLWMAEGFLQGDRRNDMEAVGNKYFEHLLQSSLFQDVQRDAFGNIIHYRIHSLVHDLACSISGSSSIHQGTRKSNDMQRVRYLTQISGDPYFTSEEAKLLRSFFYIGKFAPNLSGLSYLHTLTLSIPDLEVLPAEIETLIHLRLLDVENTSIKCLPDSICKLFNLQTLLTPEVLETLPYALIDLISLRHLSFPPIELPPGLGRLTSLQTLPYYKVGNAKGCGIGELKNLENLKGELEIQNLERVKDKADAEHADLFSKRHVYNLVLMWNGARQGETHDENVLEGLQPHPNLKSLGINGYDGKKFPLWTMRMELRNEMESFSVKLKNLTKIWLTGCRRCEEIPMVGHLQHLKFLELSDMPNVRSIGLSFYGNTSIMSSHIKFPTLEKLKLLDMPNLTDWVDVEGEDVVFPCLSYMEIKSCQLLKSVPRRFPGLEELQLEKLNEDFPLSNVCGITSSLDKLDVRELPGLVHLPGGLFVKNEEIWYMRIKSCPSLTPLVPWFLGGGASIRVLKVNDCESLNELPDDINTLQPLEKLTKLKSIPCVTSLLHFDLGVCRELSNLPSEILESCASTLSYLHLFRLDNLVFPCLQNIPCLVTLNLFNLPKPVSLPTEVISCLRNLKHLFIGGYSESMDQVSFTHYLNCILQDQHHLEFLCLVGKKDWDSLLDIDTQHLTNLQVLVLGAFRVEALPEWIGNISSLQNLIIFNCKRLKYMPSKESMQRLTKMSRLDIYGCPLMKKSFTSSDDSLWAKISHIKQVIIDHQPFTRDPPVQVQEKNPFCYPIPRRNGGGSPSS